MWCLDMFTGGFPVSAVTLSRRVVRHPTTHPPCRLTDAVPGRVRGRERAGGLEIDPKNRRRTGQRLEDGQNHPDEGSGRGREKGRNDGGIGRGMTRRNGEGHGPQSVL